MEKKISILFKNLCCSKCKSDFDESSIDIMRQENSPEENMIVAKLTCQHCGKSFGLAFLGLGDLDVKEAQTDEDIAFAIREEAPPISTDDVLDAHEFIKNLDEDWNKYLKKD